MNVPAKNQILSTNQKIKTYSLELVILSLPQENVDFFDHSFAGDCFARKFSRKCALCCYFAIHLILVLLSLYMYCYNTYRCRIFLLTLFNINKNE